MILTNTLVWQAAITRGPSTEATSHVVHLLGCGLAGVLRIGHHVACGSCHQCVATDWTVKAVAAPKHTVTTDWTVKAVAAPKHTVTTDWTVKAVAAPKHTVTTDWTVKAVAAPKHTVNSIKKL